MILTFIAFTVIFTIFGVIIFSQIQRTLFSKPHDELLSFKEFLMNNPSFPPLIEIHANKKGEPLKKNPNPRIIVLKWNNHGEIINQNEIGTRFYENFLKNYQFDKTKIDVITTITVDDLYHFSYLLFADPNPYDDVAFTQLLINVDAEYTIVDNFGKLIIFFSSIFILLSITVSYILSRQMMKPVIHSWNKQAEFVANASHELRTPLTIIQNKLELLLTTPQAKIIDKFENIALSLSETRRLSKLTSDLLTLARADSSATQLVKQAVNVDSFVEKVCTPYMEIAESQDKKFWLNLNCNVMMQGDEVRLHQLLVILLDNALKYTSKEDSIGVKTYLEDQKVVIEVQDTGIGIQEKNMKYIFERFYREDKARSRKTGGVGLGLSIAQWIVTQHGGTIKAIPNQPKGIIFKVKLPK